MPLPDLIEIQPLTAPVKATVTIPGSKSITNRALVLAALRNGTTLLKGALWSEDTQVMVDCLQRLGFELEVAPDPEESANRNIRVHGLGGLIPRGGTVDHPLELFVENAGTAARFLAALVCLGKGVYRLTGIPRMHQRPQAALFQALRQLGYQVQSDNNKLPVVIHGLGPRPGECHVSIEESSQFASALLLCAPYTGWKVNVVGENAEESPYVAMTSALLDTFPESGEFQVEPDASSASYFWGARWLLARLGPTRDSDLTVANWMQHSLQVDARFPDLLQTFPPEISRLHHLGDSIMTAVVLAPFAAGVRSFTHLGRLRVQECERVQALRAELTKCAAKVVEQGDTLRVEPGALQGAEIETYNDHRIAMCFATLALAVPGIKIKNPACVKKTFPNFFEKLAEPAPRGLGATILHGRNGQKLDHSSLHAE